jgi:hypothetical protein
MPNLEAVQARLAERGRARPVWEDLKRIADKIHVRKMDDSRIAKRYKLGNYEDIKIECRLIRI